MTIYNNFIGIDIGKFNFVVSIHGSKTTTEYQNSTSGIDKFLQENSNVLNKALCVVETTGGYELELLYALVSAKHKVHRADTRKVKNFIRSFGTSAKTDALDARAIAQYAYERHSQLELFKVKSANSIALFQLAQRRKDLMAMLVAEKNRLQAPSNQAVKGGIKELIRLLNQQLENITNRMRQIVLSDSVLNQKLEILKTIPGIGDIIALELIVLLPELGTICRRKIASLAGVAPRSNDSGKFMGYRRTGHGRGGIKPLLFLAAMAARNSKTFFKDFYEKLILKGKKKMVAITAIMRKIIVIANAKIKTLYLA